MKQISIGHDAAIRLLDSMWWNGLSAMEIALFQLSIEETCMPFGVFRIALNIATGQLLTDSAISSSLLISNIYKCVVSKNLDAAWRFVWSEDRHEFVNSEAIGAE